jgi:hypothetical protein
VIYTAKEHYKGITEGAHNVGGTSSSRGMLLLACHWPVAIQQKQCSRIRKAAQRVGGTNVSRHRAWQAPPSPWALLLLLASRWPALIQQD